MTTKEAVEILQDHNEWRRGVGKYEDWKAMPKYKAEDVGKAIEYAILILKRL